MNGWLFLIKNGDLHKIGITRYLDNRMRVLNPTSKVAKVYTSDYKNLEKILHKKYKDFRLPQTEYFRLDHFQVREIKKIICST